jgi:hypothetical protein
MAKKISTSACHTYSFDSVMELLERGKVTGDTKHLANLAGCGLALIKGDSSLWAGTMAVAMALLLSVPTVRASDACSQFKWDVGREHALFQQPATAAIGSVALASAPMLKVGTLYDLSLQPQDGVHFVHALGKKMITDGAYAGLARFKVEQSGHYRVSLGTPFWVDVVDGDQLVPTADFGGSPGCDTPHKIVEFVLPGGHDLVLQVGAGTAKDVKLSVTAIPPAP